LEPLFGVDNLQAAHQTLPKVMRQNGAIYIMPIDVFLSCNAFYTEDAFGYTMPSNASVDLDDRLDMLLCEAILKEREQT
jgi:N-acylneuraminate cytidylyltransferase